MVALVEEAVALGFAMLDPPALSGKVGVAATSDHRKQ